MHTKPFFKKNPNSLLTGDVLGAMENSGESSYAEFTSKAQSQHPH